MKMNTILLPVDFSPEAENALYYAINLARALDTKIILFHCIDLAEVSSTMQQGVYGELLADAKTEAELKLKQWCLKIEHAGGVKYDFVRVLGNTVETIISYIGEEDIDLVIMGTKGENSFSNVLFGSYTAKIMEKANCPVLAIPAPAVYSPLKVITYATNYKESDILKIKELSVIAGVFNAQLNILHISPASEHQMEEKGAMEIFMKAVNSFVSYNNLSFQLLQGEDVVQKLKEYTEQHYTNLLVTSTHNRDMFEKIFGTGITHQLAELSDVPLMAFHYNSHPAPKVFNI